MDEDPGNGAFYGEGGREMRREDERNEFFQIKKQTAKNFPARHVAPNLLEIST